ncbi:putative spermidine/putrescine transport system ATP-binding protein [Bosea psychrotolerans]|uniref:Spermidine/putrescine import ATP-binding protein PotA n=1 Tax=Bosea psychrotolerans TaxID=1871628 RepID=A0A2S4LVY8_9HYPH|nr:ABC transporter ATP-binding protein [Bosea psychrotolerans]POR46623.1 putative spermidine/putrescine transport system ATP-binding protein [Bosea psychrotolerans]
MLQSAALSSRSVGIEIEGLVKRFGSVKAVDGVSLAVEPGEFLALLGPSGSGKTTILMAIAGFEYPDEGRIRVGGEDLTWVPPNRRNLGMVFQKYTLFPHMSVLENIAFPLKMRGLGRAEREERARAALATVRLDGYGERKPSQLSGGQQQRVAIARAIVYKPRVLLMDEPLSALDKNLREEMQIETKHLQREIGITVVFVTHDQTEALTMADRVAVLDQGRLQQIGSPHDLYETPRTAFVAGFIGETNFCKGRAQGAGVAGQRIGVTLDGGDVVEATAVEAVAQGAPVRIAIRPERLSLGDPATGLAACVEEAIYAGNATTLLLALPSGQSIRLRVPAGAALASPAVGERVGLSWRVEDARAFGDAA